MATEVKDVEKAESTLILRNVRLAFPDLFEAKQFEGQGPFSYAATFLMTPDSAEKKMIDAAIQKVAEAKWGKKAKEVLKTIESQSQKFCFIDGNLKDYSGFENMWALSTKRRQEDGAPMVLDQRKQMLTAKDGKPYAGCYVNAKINIWAQDNQWGKGMRASLITVQFVKDGDAFSGAGPANDAGFEEIAVDGDDLL